MCEHADWDAGLRSQHWHLCDAACGGDASRACDSSINSVQLVQVMIQTFLWKGRGAL